jgi:hypothetical protein
MLSEADKGDPLLSMEKSRVDRILEFSELRSKEMSPYSENLNKSGSEWWISD